MFEEEDAVEKIYEDPDILGLFPSPELMTLFEELEGHDIAAWTILAAAWDNLNYVADSPFVADSQAAIETAMHLIFRKWFKNTDLEEM